ncbi:MAG: T9SS type A sorting domain-containing protein [Bacteroidetes bacterium]|nr:T9SS type A sorting domain-containing protein [Bacteroidota bacterium]
MKNKIIFGLVLICAVLISGSIKAQDNTSAKIRTKNRDTYNFPKLPMVPSPRMSVTSVIKQDFTITLRDSVVLDCSKFYPDMPNPYLPNGYPGVIMCHGYGDRKETLEGFASAQASYGYCVYTYSMRGQGNSGGLSNLISTTEAQDLMEVVNYVKKDSQSGIDSSNVLIMGGSQGGIIPYMALCYGMNVKTVISALASPEFASSWIENGSIKMTFLWTIDYTPDTARYSPQVIAMRNWVYSSSPDKWDSLTYWLPKDRNFTNLVPQNTIPILLENAWQDKFFNASGNLNTIPLLTSPKRYYFGAVRGHGGDYSLTEDQWHMNFFNEWFFFWLFNIDNGILTRPKFHYAYTSYPETSGMWTFVHDSSAVWPPNGMTNTVLYFKPNGKLETAPGTNQNANSSLANSVNKNLTMLKAVNEEFTGTTFNNQFKKASLVFQTPVLAQDLKFVGTPQIGIDYSSNAAECQFNYQIYEVNGAKSKLITRVNYTDRKNTVNSRKNTVVNGLSHGHIFRAGNKIKIIITNLDTAPDDSTFLGTNPHVLPDLKNGTSKIYYTNKSYINLPVQTVNANISGNIFLNDESEYTEQTDASAPREFRLSQNYPNPFNPSTTINYSIPQNSFVTLKIYDISGKEIAVLVNAQANPGYYSVVLNADSYKMSSGIYFYKITAGNYSEVKKLILIK